MAKHILILGGAGFLGSHLARRFVAGGDRVTVVDGLLPDTGGSLANLHDLRGAIDLRVSDIESLGADLVPLVGSAAVVIDAMAWTRHVAAIQDPLRDMRLNLASHLTLLGALRAHPSALLVYLGSRSQYGRMSSGVVTEDTAMAPQDPQGVHKVAAETHFRNYSALDGFTVVSLRLPNCFGESQPVAGEDIGLVGGFIRTLCEGAAVRIYGHGRRRTILYARDVAALVAEIVSRPLSGFVPLNVAGHDVEIRDLATRLQSLVGGGSVESDEMPAHIKAIDTGDAVVSDARLAQLVGRRPATDLTAALGATVEYFKEQLG